MREPDDGFDRFERQQVIGHSETGQHDESYRALGRDCFSKRTEPGSVDKPCANMPGGPDDRGMAVGRRYADHDVARFDQGQMGCDRRARQAIEDGDIIGFGRAAEVVERQLFEPLE